MQMIKRVTLSHILVFLLLSSAVVDATSAPQPVTPPNMTRLPNWDPSFTPVVVALGCAFLFVVFFSIYLRHCSDTDLVVAGNLTGATAHRSSCSRQGIDPKLLNTFPILVYSAIKHLKLGSVALECAVCLSEFDHHDTLRLLPTCNHVFHPECIDAWLASRVTCPVCRARLTSEHDRGGGGDNVVIVIQDEADAHQVLDESSDSRRTEFNSEDQRRRSLGRCHSTGHSLSLVETVGKDMERYTLRLSEDVRKQILANPEGGMRRSASYNVFRPPGRPGEGSSKEQFVR